MRHQKRSRRLGRTTSERKALLKSLVTAVLKRQRITTTMAKAKEARRLTDKVITLGKRGDLSSIRRLFMILQDRSLVTELVKEIAPRFKNRQGGYTRIIMLSGHRKGDNASLVLLELTEQKVVALPPKKAKKKIQEEVQETGAGKEASKEKPAKPEEKHPPKEDKRHHIEKPKKGGFFQGIQRFLKPKTGTG